MREIINIHVGFCGNQLGSEFWQASSIEHGIQPNGSYQGSSNEQLKRIEAFFDETKGGKYVPRSIFVDLEPGSIDMIKSGPYGQIFNLDNFISGKSGSSNNWAKGYYSEGREVKDSILDSVRKETEKCESLQGFQIIHSIGGGTGSGLGSLLISNLRNEHPDSSINSYTILPSDKMSSSSFEAYNGVLSFYILTQDVDGTFCFDNEALYDICFKSLNISQPTYSDLNHLICTTMSGITSSLRFPSQLNSDLKKFNMNMAPYPRMHFYIPSFAPLTSRDSIPRRALKVPELINQVFSSNNMLAACDPTSCLNICAASIFRGLFRSRK